jgi:hypothetical protein
MNVIFDFIDFVKDALLLAMISDSGISNPIVAHFSISFHAFRECCLIFKGCIKGV